MDDQLLFPGFGLGRGFLWRRPWYGYRRPFYPFYPPFFYPYPPYPYYPPYYPPYPVPFEAGMEYEPRFEYDPGMEGEYLPDYLPE